jgi:hypothetical protein
VSQQEAGYVTGTKDKVYDLIWFAEASLSNALRMETYIEDAERDGDSEVAEFFRRASNESRKGAEQAKILLASRLTDKG